MNGGAGNAGTAGAVAEFGGGAGQVAGPGVGLRGIHIDDVVMVFGKGDHDVPAEANVKGEAIAVLDIVLDIGSKLLISQVRLSG